MKTTYRLEAQPLPLTPNERCDYFVESKLAQAQYLAHRSANAHANTTTYHVLDANEEVAGFISFRVGHEDLGDRINIFFSVEYIYVLQKLRMHGLGTQLLEPLVQCVQAAMRHNSDVEGRKRVYLLSASNPESLGGCRILKALETKVWPFVRDNPDATFVGRYVESHRYQRQCPMAARICPAQFNRRSSEL